MLLNTIIAFMVDSSIAVGVDKIWRPNPASHTLFECMNTDDEPHVPLDGCHINF